MSPRYVLESRRTPILAECDVLVAGGGPAGLVAAVAAARCGARTILLERYGFLGGMATAGLVGQLLGYYAGSRPCVLGLPMELAERLIAAGGASGFVTLPFTGTGIEVTRLPYDPEVFKRVVDQLCVEAGVGLRLHTFVVDAWVEGGTARGVFVESKSGRGAIEACVVVDSTGDGDVAARAGVPFELGRRSDGALQPGTLCFRLARVDTGRAFSIPEEARRALVEEGLGRGDLFSTLFSASALPRMPAEGQVIANMTRVRGVNQTDAESMSAGEVEGRRQVFRVLDYLRAHAPGFERAELVALGSQLGIRESRHILGEYVLTREDLLTARAFPDTVVRSAYPVDVHDPHGTGVRFETVPGDETYQIPYRALVPRGVENLLIAGRCLSAEAEANAATRTMAIAMALGQAAGTAAALAADSGVAPRRLDPEVLRRRLLKDGAWLGP